MGKRKPKNDEANTKARLDNQKPKKISEVRNQRSLLKLRKSVDRGKSNFRPT